MQNIGLPQQNGQISVEDRLIWVVQYFIDNGFYVILENHLSQNDPQHNDKDGTIIPNGTSNASQCGMTCSPDYASLILSILPRNCRQTLILAGGLQERL